MEDYSKKVLREATAYNEKLDKEAKDKEDAKKMDEQNLEIDSAEESLI